MKGNWLTRVLGPMVALSLLATACGSTGGAPSPAAAPAKAETAKAEAPKTEAPKAQAPKTEAPKTAAPKAEAPKSEPAKPAAAARPVKVAFAAPVSGPMAPLGKYVVPAVEMAGEEFNKAGSARVELIFEDAGSANTSTQNAVNKLLESNPAGLYLPVATPMLNATVPILDKEKIATLIMGTTPSIYENGYKWVFGVLPNAEVEAVSGLKYVFEKLNKSRVAMITANEESGKAVAGILEGIAKAQGKTVLPTFFQIGDNDFSGNIAQARRNNPDSYLIYGPMGDNGKIVRQLKQAGVQEPIIGHMFGAEAFLALLEPAELEGVYGWMAALPQLSKVTEVQGFIKKFKDKTNLSADMSSTHAYDAAMILFNAATKAGGDRQKTIENIRATQGYKGLSGEFSYDAKGRGRFETNIIRIGANKQVQVLETVKVKLSN